MHRFHMTREHRQNAIQCLNEALVQLCTLVCNKAYLKGLIPIVPHLSNGTNGVYAIANLTEFCYGRFNGRDEVKYSEQYMRDHLVHCLEKQHFLKFPRMVTQAKINKRKPKVVNIPCDCPCKRPNCMEGMVGCDGLSGTCPSWRHRSCANISTSNVDADWFCTPHRK